MFSVRKSKGKPEWDYHTKVPAASFDEMWDDGAGRKSVQPVNVGGNSNSIWTTFAVCMVHSSSVWNLIIGKVAKSFFNWFYFPYYFLDERQTKGA